MNAKTQARIDAAAERIYRIANWAPEDRDQPLTAMDAPGLFEVREAIRLLVIEQDRDTRHACAEAVQLSRSAFKWQQDIDTVINRAHQACINTQAV